VAVLRVRQTEGLLLGLGLRAAILIRSVDFNYKTGLDLPTFKQLFHHGTNVFDLLSFH